MRDPETGEQTFARVKVPTEMLDRFVEVDDAPNTFVALEEVIAAHLESLFPGMEIAGHGFFRVTRDADFEVSDEADDLLQAVEAELRRRRFGEAVRLEVDADIDPGVRELLREALDLEERQIYDVDGLLGLGDLWQIYGVRGFNELRDPPWTPVTQPRLQGKEAEHANVMAEMRRGDILVHHPYDSFATSVERFVEQAVADPDVLAIKKTVYRTSDDSPLFPALIRATERGKQAVCMVELKARFDERANIGWARALEQAGVHVVYGYPGLKTHAKCILVVRREGDGVRHYVHVGTGNYHAKNARIYTDFGLFTCDEEIGNDVADMFNSLTGVARPLRDRKVLIAPHGMREGIIDEIDSTIAAREAGDKGARIRMKMNSLVDRRCIRALYRASQAGVEGAAQRARHLLPAPGRGGHLGEHHRHERARPLPRALADLQLRARRRELRLIGSADLMPRNLDTRVELIAPVEDDAARATCSTRWSARWRRTRGHGGCVATAHGASASPTTSRARSSASSCGCTPRAPARARRRTTGEPEPRRDAQPAGRGRANWARRRTSACTRPRAATGGWRSCSRPSTAMCRSRRGGTSPASTPSGCACPTTHGSTSRSC